MLRFVKSFIVVLKLHSGNSFLYPLFALQLCFYLVVQLILMRSWMNHKSNMYLHQCNQCYSLLDYKDCYNNSRYQTSRSSCFGSHRMFHCLSSQNHPIEWGMEDRFLSSMIHHLTSSRSLIELNILVLYNLSH